MVEVIKILGLNVLPLTRAKDKSLLDLLLAYRSASNELWDMLDFWDEIPNVPERLTRFNVQHLVYHSIKYKYGLHAEHIVDLVKDVFACKDNARHINNHVSFNIPRSGNIRATKRGNPIISVATLNDRIGLPISQDGAFRRFKQHIDNGFSSTHFRLIKTNTGWKIQISIRKEVELNTKFNTILGVDIGVKRLASITILGSNKVIRQGYLGRDVGHVQRNISIRRSKLKSHNCKKSLKKLKGFETNFVKTRCYQVAHEIINLAKAHNSIIAIENLTGLRNSKGNRKSNRKNKRMPYHRFRVALETVAWQNAIPVIAIDPAYTSKTCPRCGKIGIRNKIFKCRCGYIANSDRSASHNIALKASENFDHNIDFSTQISEGDLAVTPSVSSNAVV